MLLIALSAAQLALVLPRPLHSARISAPQLELPARSAAPVLLESVPPPPSPPSVGSAGGDGDNDEDKPWYHYCQLAAMKHGSGRSHAEVIRARVYVAQNLGFALVWFSTMLDGELGIRLATTVATAAFYTTLLWGWPHVNFGAIALQGLLLANGVRLSWKSMVEWAIPPRFTVHELQVYHEVPWAIRTVAVPKAHHTQCHFFRPCERTPSNVRVTQFVRPWLSMREFDALLRAGGRAYKLGPSRRSSLNEDERQSRLAGLLPVEGETTETFIMLTRGTCGVFKQGVRVNTLEAGALVGEGGFSSFEAGNRDCVASATVVPDGPIELMAWPYRRLARHAEGNARVKACLMNVVAAEASRKLRLATEQLARE